MNGAFLYSLTIGICLGIAAAFLLGFGEAMAVILLVLAAASIAVTMATRARASSHILFLCAVFTAASALGLMRAQWELAHERAQTVAGLIGKTVVIDGTVADDPDMRGSGVRATIDMETIDGAPARGALVATFPSSVRVSYAQRVEVRGALEAPAPFSGEAGRLFDYPDYLRMRSVQVLMRHARLDSMQRAPLSLRGTLFSVKHSLEHSLERVFALQESALVSGILFGERSSLPKDIERVLVAAGLIHIVILAGYALGLVSQGVLSMLSFLPPRARYALAALGLILFVMMTGAAATTVRAAAMAVIAMLARVLKRPTVALRSLCVVGLGMVLYNPLIVLYDESFIISTLATFGLIALAPQCERWLAFLPERFDLRGIAASTLSVQIFALPAVLYFTGTLAPWALLANLAALPALPWVMFFGFASAILGLLHPILAALPAFLTHALLRYIFFVADAAAKAPLGGIVVPAFSPWLMILTYAPLFAWALHAYNAVPQKSRNFSGT